jgi:hypothetical protein
LEQVRALVIADVSDLIDDLQALGEPFPAAATWATGWWLGELTAAAAEGVALAADHRIGPAPR